VTPPILNVTGIPKFEGISALIVEDNKFNQIILQRMLESLGVDCDIANNGLECLSIWQERNYDLILMDLNMPGLDGIETTKRILKDAVHEPIPKIIAVTANVLDQDEQRCLDAGMHSFLPKPITMAELSSRIVAATADS
jgi:CheY-like chemotaxis protein